MLPTWPFDHVVRKEARRWIPGRAVTAVRNVIGHARWEAGSITTPTMLATRCRSMS